jgi:hypothetical protein
LTEHKENTMLCCAWPGAAIRGGGYVRDNASSPIICASEIAHALPA